MAKESNMIQGLIAVIIAGISAYFQIIAVPLIFLIAVMILDYITGMISAYNRKELSSRQGITGIFKKTGYLCLVAVGITVDYIINSALASLGIASNISMMFGLIVTIWLIINELISILENLTKLEVPVPEFLVKFITRLKNSVENTGKDNSEN